MKWNILLGTLVLGLALSTQSFGFELLNRMLGGGCTSNCCEPACGCDDDCDPGCGCDNGCDDGCDPACGCDNGCDDGCSGSACGKKRMSLLERLGCQLSHSNSCCEPACGCDDDCDPACGCDNGCDNGCDPACGCDNGCDNGCDDGCDGGCCGSKKHGCGGLLDRIFAHKPRCCKKSCCDDGCSGCAAAPYSGEEAAPEAADAAPMPPAPVVDPSAFVPGQQRVLRVSSNLVR